MSIYYKEKPEFFDRCMKSIWDEQTVKPNEIILVQDGPLTNELNKIITKWQDKLGKILVLIPLSKNVGLGEALNIGLDKCKYDLIARMDTDDIALPNRFEKQLKILNKKNIDICGSWVSEFDNDENKIISYRKVPEKQDEIVKFAKKRNPLNHPSVMYKKSSVLKAGGYQHMLWFEDYYLWVRMMLNGAKFYNIQEPLVKMRAGYGQLERRRGFKYAMAEYNFLKELKEIRFLNNLEFYKNILTRIPARLLPKSFVKQIYHIIRKK
jgi:glycosyltransferase involved in cell wall biosynthesis